MTAVSRNISALDIDNRGALISAADTGTALIELPVLTHGSLYGASRDRDVSIRIHAAADSRAHTVGRVGRNGAAVNGNIGIVESRAFVADGSAVRIAAADPAADSTVALSINCASVDDDFTAVYMVAAADSGSAALRNSSNRPVIDGNGSPGIIPGFLIGTTAGAVAGIVGAADAGAIAG